MNNLWIKFIGFILVYAWIFLVSVSAQTSTFNTPGGFTVPNFSGSLDPGDLVLVDLDLIIVGAGGGGGRGNGAGGGGGGQVIQMTITANEGDILTGFIGTGGMGGRSTVPNDPGLNGTASTFNGISATGGFGGGGGNAGNGGVSGSGLAGGGGEEGSSREAGGGGAGAGGSGTNGNAATNPLGGNGGIGFGGFGGGGGGTARRPGAGTTTLGSASDGGTFGSTGVASDAANGGGGGGGRSAGGRGGHGLVVVSVNFRVLPVEFLYFKSEFNSLLRSANLSWSTAKEWENSHFEVQRSVNDVRSWETIATVKGAGYSDQAVDYAYQDLKLPLAGGNIFYRIRQVDLSGKATFSDTEAIRVEPIPRTTYWRVYPNPTTGETINFEQLVTTRKNDTKVLVRVISSSGQVDVIEGYATAQLSPLLSDVMKRKNSGLYTLEISWDDSIEYHKVILKR